MQDRALAKIGLLVLENDVLREQFQAAIQANAQLQAQLPPADASSPAEPPPPTPIRRSRRAAK